MRDLPEEHGFFKGFMLTLILKILQGERAYTHQRRWEFVIAEPEPRIIGD